MTSLSCRLAPTPLALLFLVALGAGVASAQSSAAGPPPASRRDDVVDDIHGVKIADPYRWLEDQQSPETRAWIKAQNDYAEPILKALPGREALRQQLTNLMRIDAVTMPTERHGRYFFEKRQRSQDLFVIYMRQGAGGPDEVLVDPASMSADHTVSVDLYGVSQDASVIAYAVRQGGQDEEEVRFLDVNTRHELPDRLPKARYFGVSLRPDLSGFYYTRENPEGARVYYHAMGTSVSSDPEVFGQGRGPTEITSTWLSEDGHYLLFVVSHGSAAEQIEVYVQDLARGGPIVPVVNDLHSRFIPSVAGDKLVLQTDWKAPMGRMMVADMSRPDGLARDHWREIVPETDAVIESFSLVGGKLFVNYSQNANSRLKIFDLDGHPSGEIAFPTLGTVSGVGGRWSSHQAFFQFSSFFIPPTIYSYDVPSLSQKIWARLEVPIHADDFELKQVWYTSKDGTNVPMFLVSKKGFKLDGRNPALLTGYGGFQIAETPYFSAAAVAWAESGGVFAVANLRGGSEFGEKWHRAGMLGNKQNVFDDFFAAADWLIAQKYTSPSKLAIMGGSNGGLLMGAALTQRPDLFRAALCRFPLLDMLRYQDFLVAKFWVPEYGAADNPEQFKFLYAYSPYQHVVKGTNYPAILFVSGDSDTRVAPLHARKMTALVQWAAGSSPSARPVLLKYDTTSGHVGGGKPLTRQIDDLTDELGFLLWQVGAE